MNIRALTTEQINYLFDFCRMRSVYHYDLQVELVDHLASAIEQKLEERPTLSFDDALKSEFKQFGIYGFSKIKETKQKELKRKYTRLQWKYIQEFFQLPKIILTVAVTVALFLIFRISENDLKVSLIFLAIYLVILIVFLTVLYPKKFRLTLIPGKSFLLYDHFKTMKMSIFAAGSLPVSIFNILINRHNTFNLNIALTNNIYGEFLSAFLITLFGIFMVAMATYIPQRIKEDFTRDYPQFVKS
jgi:hypothetical protein